MPTNKNAMTRYRILDRLLSDKYHNGSMSFCVGNGSRRLH